MGRAGRAAGGQELLGHEDGHCDRSSRPSRIAVFLVLVLISRRWDPDAVQVCVPALPRGVAAEAFLRVMKALSQGFAEAVERSSLWLPSESRFLALSLNVYLFSTLCGVRETSQ